MLEALYSTEHASPHLLPIRPCESLRHLPVPPTETGGNHICNTTALKESGHLNILVKGFGKVEHFLHTDSDNRSLCVTPITEESTRMRMLKL